MKYVLVILSIPFLLEAQTPEWWQLPFAPVEQNSRFEDVYFVNENKGWIVTRPGKVFRTDDGGNSWQLLYQRTPGQVLFRCMTFRDSLTGWIGDITSETNADGAVFYQTTDGGFTWNPHTLPDPVPKGLCGMFNLDNQNIYGVGRYYGDASFIKSSDGGLTWTVKDLTSQIRGLVDVYFFNPDTGIAVGSIQQNGTKGVIIKTTDGGENWDIKHVTSATGVACWKQSYPDLNNGFVSFQEFTNRVFMIKTTDNGETWTELLSALGASYSIQGILFIDSLNGWVSGYANTSQTYRTTDGGITWSPDHFGKRINRFRMLTDSLGYAAGETVYKYSPYLHTSNIAEEIYEGDFNIFLNYPNPFNPSTTIIFSLDQQRDVSIKIFDILGKKVEEFFFYDLSPGKHKVDWEANGFSSGAYLCTINDGNSLRSIKLLLLK